MPGSPSGATAAEALNSGYHLAYLIGAGLVVVAIAIAVGVLREEAPEAAAEPVPEPAAEPVPAAVGEAVVSVAVAGAADRPAVTVNYLPAATANPGSGPTGHDRLRRMHGDTAGRGLRPQ